MVRYFGPLGLCHQSMTLPLTPITIIFVASDDKTLYRKYKEPTKKMVLVVNGRAGRL